MGGGTRLQPALNANTSPQPLLCTGPDIDNLQEKKPKVQPRYSTIISSAKCLQTVQRPKEAFRIWQKGLALVSMSRQSPTSCYDCKMLTKGNFQASDTDNPSHNDANTSITSQMRGSGSSTSPAAFQEQLTEHLLERVGKRRRQLEACMQNDGNEENGDPKIGKKVLENQKSISGCLDALYKSLRRELRPCDGAHLIRLRLTGVDLLQRDGAANPPIVQFDLSPRHHGIPTQWVSSVASLSKYVIFSFGVLVQVPSV